MLALELVAVGAAGAAAGTTNALAGAGSLITFPTMVALGVPQLAANVTSTVGLIPGAVGGSLGYADLLADQRRRLGRLLVPSLAGAAAGTALLLLTPGRTFEAVVPGLIAASCVLLLLQPMLARRMPHAGNERSPALGAVQRLNGIKILLAGLMNLLAAIAYAFLAPVDWPFAAALMIASLAGGRAGAQLARRVPGGPLRVAIACAGLLVAAVLAVRQIA